MELQTLVSEVATFTQQRLAHYVQELTALCAIDSGSYYKLGLDVTALHLANRLRDIGMHTTIIENDLWGNDLLATIKGIGSGNVLLLGHMDTVGQQRCTSHSSVSGIDCHNWRVGLDSLGICSEVGFGRCISIGDQVIRRCLIGNQRRNESLFIH